ncbi:MAG: FadR family transcriptional regulator [Rhodoferax sp.]|nr:FadR family transcriptional regulator [Rhodoferax sp.]
MAEIEHKAAAGAQARTGVVDRIYREVLASIIAGEFREGDKLPTELALTERFAASRPAIREALARLRADGVTSTRQGSGTVVQRRPDPDMPRFTPLENLSDVQRCFEFRVVVESGAAELAARKAGPADMALIEQSLRNLDTVIAEHGVGAREDYEFHLALARASHNQFFVSAIAQMQEQVLVSMNLMRNMSLTKSAERQQVVQAEHAAIVAAVRRHDGPGANMAMRQHLEFARNRMFGA